MVWREPGAAIDCLPREIIERAAVSLLDQRLVASDVMKPCQSRKIGQIQSRIFRYELGIRNIDRAINAVLFRWVLLQELRGRREFAETARGHGQPGMPPLEFDGRLNETG